MNRKCNLIIDTSCDLPSELVKVEGVYVTRVHYIVDDEVFEDDMYTQQTPAAFFDKMRSGLSPKTSQPSPHELNEIFAKASSDGMPCVFLVFSSGLAGNFETACSVAETFDGGKIHVVDTKLASIAEGLLVQEAINLMTAGHTAAEIVRWAEEARYYVDALFMVEDLETLKRGGRIAPSVAVAGTALDVKPLLNFTLEGALKIAGVARGRKKGIKQLVSYYEKNRAEGAVLVGDADCEKDAEKLLEALVKSDDSIRLFKTNIGPVIGSHVGPGMLAIAFWAKDRRERMSITDKIIEKVKVG